MEQRKIIVNKFGGGIMKDADAIRHLPQIFENHIAGDSINVFSAFGKTTDKLEKIVQSQETKGSDETERLVDELMEFHKSLASELFPTDHIVFQVVDTVFEEIKNKLSNFKSEDKDYIYDQIVPYGEILASIVVSHYLSHVGIENELAYATDFIRTDANFKAANVDKIATAENLKLALQKGVLQVRKHIITQGFIGFSDRQGQDGTVEKHMTTLGREGSDFTAGILGNLLDADKVVLYKDVKGVMDKNPHLPGNEDAEKKDYMTYEEAEENFNTTAKGLVHPKTINELKPKNIPLQVRPFWDLDSEGTVIR